ncbi:pyridoxamine 5'-phosphate oxidase-like FMN-binding protein [Pseudomonas putida S11]|nr:pyridoxamine 5'-phosphate oxidase-like FMN-binding protein [Pseudomonas putida S11]
MSTNAIRPARELLLKEYRGVLSTHSKSMPGYPFGSVVPYCLDAQGNPLILISRIAQHTHNLQKDPKCSLLVGEREAEDVQAVGRLTVMAEAHKLVEEAAIEAAAERYYRYFPGRGQLPQGPRLRLLGAAAGAPPLHRRLRRDPLARSGDPGQPVRRQGRDEHGRAHEQRPRQRHRPLCGADRFATPCASTDGRGGQ